jgi:hypothetical protein
LNPVKKIRIIIYIMIVETIIFALTAGVEGFLVMLSITLTYTGLVELAFKLSEAPGMMLLLAGLAVALLAFTVASSTAVRVILGTVALIALIAVTVIKKRFE